MGNIVKGGLMAVCVLCQATGLAGDSGQGSSVIRGPQESLALLTRLSSIQSF